MISLTSKNKKGFRFSIIDGIFIISVIAFLEYIPKENTFINHFFHLFVVLILCNFFLFCNVFRVRTKFELIWCLLLFINTIFCLFYYQNNILFSIIQSIFTVFIISYHIKFSFYTGIFSKAKI